MILVVTLSPSPDGASIVAVGWLAGAKPMLIFCIAPTAWETFEGLFAQAVCIERVMAPKRWPLTTIGVN